MKQLLSTKDVAQFLNINEKMVYTLVSDKGLPATKITGKWLFPRHLVEQWVETHTDNYPASRVQLPPYHGLLIITGSNDPLLDRTINLFNQLNSDHIAVFGNLGSMGGLKALRQNRCHLAASHLMQDDGSEYNFEFIQQELRTTPAVVNFCRREQGLILSRGNPKHIRRIGDLAQPNLRLVNRALGTGTRLLLDHELRKAGIAVDTLDGYQHEVARHLDIGLEVLAGRADAGPGIRAVASLLNLEFLPLRWERFDLMIAKDHFFDEGIQRFLGILHEAAFRGLAKVLSGYDLSLSGKMVYPHQNT